MKKPSKPFVFGCLFGFLVGPVVVAAGGIAVAYGFKDAFATYQAEKLRVPPITSGLKADYNWKIAALDGPELDMASLRGEVVFLHFWHPNCISCQAEAPAINRLYENLAGENVHFVCVARGEEEDVRQASEEQGMLFPVYLTGEKWPKAYTVSATPATFILAPSGDIAFKHLGGAKWDDPSVVAFLRLLAKGAGEP